MANTAKASVNFCALFLRSSGSISSSSELPTSVARKPMSNKNISLVCYWTTVLLNLLSTISSQSFCIFVEIPLCLRHFGVVFTKKSDFLVPLLRRQCYDQSFQGKVSAASKQGTQVSSIGSTPALPKSMNRREEEGLFHFVYNAFLVVVTNHKKAFSLRKTFFYTKATDLWLVITFLFPKNHFAQLLPFIVGQVWLLLSQWDFFQTVCIYELFLPNLALGNTRNWTLPDFGDMPCTLVFLVSNLA